MRKYIMWAYYEEKVLVALAVLFIIPFMFLFWPIILINHIITPYKDYKPFVTFVTLAVWLLFVLYLCILGIRSF